MASPQEPLHGGVCDRHSVWHERSALCVPRVCQAFCEERSSSSILAEDNGSTQVTAHVHIGAQDLSLGGHRKGVEHFSAWGP